jgi:hypothetical protein
MGCDSIVTIKLTIFEPGKSSQNVSACRYYILPHAGTVIEKSGTYTETLTNWKGCDSIITYNITIKTIDNSTFQDGSLLKANSVTATYQWLNCNQGYRMIPGETNRTYIATANQKYAVELTENGCKDTSDCIQVVNAGNTSILVGEIAVVPNPSNGQFELRFNQEMTMHIWITNTMGEMVYEVHVNQTNRHAIELNVPAGMYQLHIQSGQLNAVRPLVIQP